MSENRAASERRATGLDTPIELRPGVWSRLRPNPDAFGQLTEGFARFMGTPQFLLWMSVFVFVWLGWNTIAPESMQFDPRALNYTLLTLMLSLQASYAAPLLLLAQNRQDDRDKVVGERDRKRAQENLADTEYLTREIAALRMSMREVATRDYVRSELRDLLQELVEELGDDTASGEAASSPGAAKKKKAKKKRTGETISTRTGMVPVVAPAGTAAPGAGAAPTATTGTTGTTAKEPHER